MIGFRRWWLACIWWVEFHTGMRRREVLDLQRQVAYWRRMWESADGLTKSLSAALKDCAEAGLAASAERDVQINSLTVRLAVKEANQGLMTRYISAISSEQMTADFLPLVEGMQIGIYRSKDKTHILATYKPLTEEQSAGWELLDIDAAVRELKRRARMAMGVWN